MYYNEFDGSLNRRSINDTTKLNPVKKSIKPIVYVKPINTQPFEYETPTRPSKYDNSMTNKTQFYKYRQDIVQFLQQTQPNINLLNKSLTYEVYNYNDPEYLKQVEGARRNGLDAKSIALIYKPPKKMVYSTMKEAADSLTGLMGYLQKLTTTDAVQTAADKKVIKDLIDKTIKEAQADEIKKNEDFLKDIRDKQIYDLIPTVRPIPTDSKLGEVLDDKKGDYVFDDTRLNQFMVDNERLLSSDNMKQYNIAYGLALYNLMKEYYIYYTLDDLYTEDAIMNDLYNKMDNTINPIILQDTYSYIEKNQQLKYTNVDYDPYYRLSRIENKKIQDDFYKLMEDFITSITDKNNIYDLASSDEEENKAVNLNPPGSDDEDLNAVGGPAVQPVGPVIPQAPATPPVGPQPAGPQPVSPIIPPQPAGPVLPDPLLLQPPAQPQPQPAPAQPQPQPDPNAGQLPALDENIFVTIPNIGRDRLEKFKFNGSQYISTIFDYKTDEKDYQQFLKGDRQRPPGTDNNTYRSNDGKNEILCASCNKAWGRHKPTPENKDNAHSLTKKHPQFVLLRFMMLAGDTRYYNKNQDKKIFDAYPEKKFSIPTSIKDMNEQTRENLLNNYIQWFNTNVATFAGQGMQDGQGVKVVYIQPKKNSTLKSNGWLKHVKEISDREKISWSAALKKAKLTYKK